jgi:creatinine amidohydrolase/Fe(II)-dependent formamide hydrolase-like protein
MVFFQPIAHAQSRSLFIEDLTWTEVRDAVAAGTDTAIIYAGSTEQNGPHMALGKHNFIARYVAQRIASNLGNALVYPVLPFAPTGDPVTKTDHMRFPGSVSVSESTFAAVAREFAQSAAAAGFRNIALMGDHGGGQDALARVASELTTQWRAQGIRVLYVPDAYVKSFELVTEFLARQNLSPGQHAALSDTAELMAIDTEGRWIRRDKMSVGNSANGVDGDPRQASVEFGRQFLQLKVDSAVAQIRSLTTQPR